MSIAQTILPQFEQEMTGTRTVLERVPSDKLTWRAHPKMNTIGWNAAHLSEMPGWVEMALTMDTLDINPVDGPKYQSPPADNPQRILEVFDKNVARAKQLIALETDEHLLENWSLLSAGQTILTMTRIGVIRDMVISHIIHHRAHLIVYLRLNDVSVPGMYGPGADESF